MERYLADIARISGMNCIEIVNLHFDLQNLIKDATNPDQSISLCEKAVAISGLVMNAMKKKHRAECDEYARTMGKLSPNSKFYYPNHYAAGILCKYLRSLHKDERAYEIELKMNSEGWNTGRYAELRDL